MLILPECWAVIGQFLSLSGELDWSDNNIAHVFISSHWSQHNSPYTFLWFAEISESKYPQATSNHSSYIHQFVCIDVSMVFDCLDAMIATIATKDSSISIIYIHLNFNCVGFGVWDIYGRVILTNHIALGLAGSHSDSIPTFSRYVHSLLWFIAASHIARGPTYFIPAFNS